MATAPHIPVLLDEVVAALAPRDGDIVVDGTLGAGGYARAVLAAAACRVYGIDRDPVALALGQALAAAQPGRFVAVAGCFGAMDDLLAEQGVDRADGVALDLGVSSMQVDSPERGFSFRAGGPLDMRMGRDGPTAADLVNGVEEQDLADLIFRLGEERSARRVARAIVIARTAAPIVDTAVLAEVVARAIGRGGADKIHPATRTFQALRIAVNDELGELARGLEAAERLLAPGGRLAVVSFHSLEDRMVKQFLARRSGAEGGPSRHAPVPADGSAPTFERLFRGAVKPSDAEIRVNPRARSARLRAARRTAAPAWTGEGRP